MIILAMDNIMKRIDKEFTLISLRGINKQDYSLKSANSENNFLNTDSFR
jgi:hypothetical protein